MPERTLRVGGYLLPVCARDTGGYIGLLLGYFLLFTRRKKACGPPNLFITLLTTMPMIIDAGTQWMGLRSSTNDLRLLTGLLFGVFLTPLLIYLLAIIPSSRKLPVLGALLPERVELDCKDRWISNRSLTIGFITVCVSFFAINSIVGSDNPVYYWILSTIIVSSVIWHIFLIPLLIITLSILEIKRSY
ncbi:MAG: DUF2085 domain-containing protein [Thermoproteota archaeon]